MHESGAQRSSLTECQNLEFSLNIQIIFENDRAGRNFKTQILSRVEVPESELEGTTTEVEGHL